MSDQAPDTIATAPAFEPALTRSDALSIKEAVLRSGPSTGQSHVEHATALIAAFAVIDAAADAPAPAAPAEGEVAA